MPKRLNPPRRSLALAPTRGTDSRQLRDSARPRVALIEGSPPGQSQETRDLFRNRLRIVAILLGAGFALFLLRSFWFFDQYAVGPHAIVFYAHLTVTLLLGLVAHRLCTHCRLIERNLAWAEAIIFGAPTAFFLLLGYHKLIFCAELSDGHSHIPSIAGAWSLLIFSYALFVPNTWRRGAIVMSLMGVAPVLVMGWAYIQSSAFAELARIDEFRGIFTEHILIMLLTVLTATVGVKTIGSLRREAFVARQLGQYRLKQMLGSGGMGEVYLAEHQTSRHQASQHFLRISWRSIRRSQAARFRPSETDSRTRGRRSEASLGYLPTFDSSELRVE